MEMTGWGEITCNNLSALFAVGHGCDRKHIRQEKGMWRGGVSWVLDQSLSLVRSVSLMLNVEKPRQKRFVEYVWEHCNVIGGLHEYLPKVKVRILFVFAYRGIWKCWNTWEREQSKPFFLCLYGFIASYIITFHGRKFLQVCNSWGNNTRQDQIDLSTANISLLCTIFASSGQTPMEWFKTHLCWAVQLFSYRLLLCLHWVTLIADFPHCCIATLVQQSFVQWLVGFGLWYTMGRFPRIMLWEPYECITVIFFGDREILCKR